MKKFLMSAFALTLSGAACSPAVEDETDALTGDAAGFGAPGAGDASHSSAGGSLGAGMNGPGGATRDAGNVPGATADAQPVGSGSDAGSDASSVRAGDAGASSDGDAGADASREGGAPDGATQGGSDAGTDGGNGGPSCDLPTTFKWTGGGPLAQPKNGWVSMKDVTHVFHNGQHILYYTTFQSNWGSGMMTFKDWPEAATAPQTPTSFGVAPTLFYFTPKNVWVLAYQWGPHKFSYRTSSDPTNPSGWSGEKSLYNTALPAGGTGPIDQTVICDSAKCYLYYAGDNGHIYQSSMPIASFPGEFPAAEDSGIVGTAQNLFEGVQVYKLKGSDKYLMLVEAQGVARYFRAWTATSLEGPWALLTNDFAVKKNVTLTTNWTNDISHGDLVRSSADETFTVDPCNLQLVFQGRDPSINTDYGRLPYRLGLITLQR
jgi:Glycosyl hydrolase family 62